MLVTKEQFEEWMDSDEIDGTISGIDRLTWTIATAFATLLSAEYKTEIKPSQFIPGASKDESILSGQSPEEQRAACEKIAAMQNASMR